ncbi:GMC family oxidoreductase N-terminal domain-containing protein [Bradyrhizobium sp. UNPF46]|uniref:GMC family oxidoreductase N-terminal domain-containing protein n=1 Tax=Bradyrhizobium sp. UNPF46 TaxID=1141168 RepID=UPI0032DFB9DD
MALLWRPFTAKLLYFLRKDKTLNQRVPGSSPGAPTIVTHAQASKVAFDGRVATGVEWISKGQVHKATADREVILSDGALQSPQIPSAFRRRSGRAAAQARHSRHCRFS